MSRVTHFDVEATDPARAIAFYRDVFGWTFEQWDGPIEYWLITTGPPDEPGIDGGLARRDGPSPGQDDPTPTFTCTVEVEDVASIVESITDHGGEVVRDVQPIPGVGWIAYCLDTEGNRFGVMENDESAA